MEKTQFLYGAATLIVAGWITAANTAPALTAADKQVAQQVEKALRTRYTSPNKSLRLVVRPTTRSRDGYFSEIIVEGKPVQIKGCALVSFPCVPEMCESSWMVLKRTRFTPHRPKRSFALSLAKLI